MSKCSTFAGLAGLIRWQRSPMADGSACARGSMALAQAAECDGEEWSSLSDDDAALVAACLDGRHDAFDVIVERHRRSVYQVCYRFVGNHEDASDLSQEAFLRAWRGLKNFKGEAALSTWLYRIAVNVCLNRVGARKPGHRAASPRSVCRPPRRGSRRRSHSGRARRRRAARHRRAARQAARDADPAHVSRACRIRRLPISSAARLAPSRPISFTRWRT